MIFIALFVCVFINIRVTGDFVKLFRGVTQLRVLSEKFVETCELDVKFISLLKLLC